MNEQKLDRGACPNCGKPDGARSGSSRWGHDYACCSDACGVAFASSSKRAQLELNKAYDAQADAEARVQMWSKAQDVALYREIPGRRRQLALDLAAQCTLYAQYDAIVEALAAGEVTPEEVVEPMLKWAREQASAAVLGSKRAT